MNIIVSLKCGLKISQVIESGTFSISPFIVTMAASSAISEILGVEKDDQTLKYGFWVVQGH